MAAVQSITIGDRVIDLHKFTGEVVDEKMWTTTQVISSGGNYNVGSGQHNPVSISSSSTTHDQFFLKDENGQEMAADLGGTGVAIRKGHRVTLIWGMVHGQERGPFLAVHNHSMGAPAYIDSAIQSLVGPTAPGWSVIAWFFSILGICFYGVGFIGVIVLVVMGRSRKRQARENSAILKSAVGKLLEPGA